MIFLWTLYYIDKFCFAVKQKSDFIFIWKLIYFAHFIKQPLFLPLAYNLYGNFTLVEFSHFWSIKLFCFKSDLYIHRLSVFA